MYNSGLRAENRRALTAGQRREGSNGAPEPRHERSHHRLSTATVTPPSAMPSSPIAGAGGQPIRALTAAQRREGSNGAPEPRHERSHHRLSTATVTPPSARARVQLRI